MPNPRALMPRIQREPRIFLVRGTPVAPGSASSFGQHLAESLPVREELRLLALIPGRSESRGAQVPVRPDLLRDRPEILAQLPHRRPSPKPVAVVDLEDAQTWLEYQRVGNHGIVVGVAVLLDVQVLLDHPAGVGQERPLRADAVPELIGLQ